MLRELHISNLAVIEDVSIELAPGLNCFTGQTGAGKSLVLGAFEILLGLRASDAQMLRPGSSDARVSGVFELHDAQATAAIAQLIDSELAPGEQLLISRKIFASGRSSISVNGQPATTAMLRQIGELLVDIHGQHDHQFLLKSANQMQVLDHFAGCTELRQQFTMLDQQLRQMQRQQHESTASRTLRRQQIELYEFQLHDIEQANPQPGELAELSARHQLLANLQRIQREAGQAQAALYEAEGAVVERLQVITQVLCEISELDASLKPTAEQVRDATSVLSDAAFELRRYIERLELDPGELKEVEDRLNTLHRLLSKYTDHRPSRAASSVTSAPGEDAIVGLLQYRDSIAHQLAELKGQDDNLANLGARIADTEKELRTLGQQLSKARQSAAKKLRPLVEAQLKELGMAEAQFEVELTPVTSAPGLVASDDHASQPAEVGDHPDDINFTPAASDAHPWLSTGMERIELVVRTNPGQAARPLRKIASGGELSRIMLALKAILAASDRVSVLVFDEIDANIGGRLGSVIGHKLRQLAGHHASSSTPTPKTRGKSASPKSASRSFDSPVVNSRAATSEGGTSGVGGHQVLCITHLPQIAAHADRHLKIDKRIITDKGEKATRTVVSTLEGEARIEELAEMLAGKAATATTRTQAKELLEAALT